MRPLHPWYRAAKDTWYCTIEGRKVSLRVRGRDNEPAALAAWHRLLTRGREASPVARDGIHVSDLVAKYLSDAASRVKRNTLATYSQLLRQFTDSCGSMLASRVTKRRVASLAAEYSASHGCNLIGCIASVYRWGVENGHLTANPLQGVKRPRKASRGASCVVDEASFERLCSAASATFRPLLLLLWETGARPSELTRLVASDVDFAAGVARLTEHKTASSGRVRIVVLSDAAVELLRDLVAARPTGTILATRAGKPWTQSKVVRSMRRACQRAGVTATAYGLRHTYATRALVAGIPDATVAALLGHSSTAMLHRHYSHLSEQTRALREAANRVSG